MSILPIFVVTTVWLILLRSGSVVIHQYLVCRPFQVVKLPGSNGPEKNSRNDQGNQQGDGDQQVNDFHFSYV